MLHYFGFTIQLVQLLRVLT